MGADEGWLADGFLEGQWIRIVDLSADGNPDIEAKIQLIRGDNDSKDARLQLINVQINGVEVAGELLSSTWIGSASASDPAQVQVVRIAAELSFSGDDETDQDAWHKLQKVTLTADEDYVVPPTRDGVKIFPVQTHLLSKLRGPLAVEGGPAGADRSLTAGVKLPGEKDDFLIAIGAQPPESQQIDVLNIYNDSSQADASGIMDQTTLRGFGMASDLVFENVSGPLFGEAAEGSTSITVPGGISFGKVNFGAESVGTDADQSTIEVVNLMLGQGNDHLDIVGTLDPAPYVSAQNEFDFFDIGADPDAENLFAGDYTVRSEVIDWKAEGFLPAQQVNIDGVTGIVFEVVSVEDAVTIGGNGGIIYDDGAGNVLEGIPGGGVPVGGTALRDPNDNSILVLSVFSHSGVLADRIAEVQAAFASEVRLVAVDNLVLESVTYDVEETITGAVLTRSDGVNWEDAGYLAGHLINIGGENGSFDDALQYRVLEIENNIMEILGEPLADAIGETSNIWIQAEHGSLTMVHGGGNLPVETLGDYTMAGIVDTTGAGEGGDGDTLDDTLLLRQDGRDWSADGYEVGQIIQVGDEALTRTIVEIGNAED